MRVHLLQFQQERERQRPEVHEAIEAREAAQLRVDAEVHKCERAHVVKEIHWEGFETREIERARNVPSLDNEEESEICVSFE